MVKKALITGIGGQDASYLAKFLLEKDYEVYGLLRRCVGRNLDNLKFLGIEDQIKYVDGDMTDECSLINAIKTIQPDEVYNLAAQSFVKRSWDYPVTTTDINALGALKLLNAIKHSCPTAKYYQASTSEMFGSNHDDGIQSEKTFFHPRSPYGVAKLYAHWMTINYRESYGLFACCGIMFNHESPLRGLEFVTRKITDGIARIHLGLADHITLGNLETNRDWGFAGDYVEAMWMMLQEKTPDDYVISTNQTHSIKEFLDIAFSYVRIKDWEKYIKTDPKFMRPADVVHLHGDNTKAINKLGWKPKLTFEQLIKMMVAADIERLS